MNRRNAGFVGILIVALFSAMFSCTKVDNTLGNSLIPEDQQMQIFIDTVQGVNAYLGQVDSFPLNVSRASWFYGCIGAKKDATYGTFESGWLGQYGSSVFYTSNKEAPDRYGIATVGDSICLYLAFNAATCYGDTSKKQTFNVYEVTKRLYTDSTYYMGYFKAEDVIDPEPLLTFDYKLADGVSVQKQMTSAKALALMDRLIKAKAELYDDDSLFVDEFKGLYIAPSGTSPKDAAALSIETSATLLTIYARSFTDETATTVKDTLIGSYSFNMSTHPKLLTMNTYKRDYKGSAIDVARINDTLSTSVPVSVGYVQGCGGVTTYLRFPKSFVENLKALAKAPYKTMVINSARIEIGIYEPTIPALDAATIRLGSYVDYARFVPINDYPYEAEVSQYNPIKLAYGGYMNRSHNSYTMDISRTIQIMVDIAPQDYLMNVGPSFFEIYDPGKEVRLQTVTNGANPLPLKVAVTYTLLKDKESK